MLGVLGLIYGVFLSVIRGCTPYDPTKEIPEEVCKECLVGNQPPEWIFTDPDTGEKMAGELIDISLNKGKPDRRVYYWVAG